MNLAYSQDQLLLRGSTARRSHTPVLIQSQGNIGHQERAGYASKPLSQLFIRLLKTSLDSFRLRRPLHMTRQTLKPVGCYGRANAKALPDMFMKAAFKHGGTQIQATGREIIGNVRPAVSGIGWRECSGADGSAALLPKSS